MGSNVKQRFQLVLEEEPPARAKGRLWAGCILCVVLFVMSYMVILQPVFPPPTTEDGYRLVALTPENTYVLHTNDGAYAVYYNGEFYGIISSEESLLSPPYCDLPIIQEGGTITA